jgi:hypothetical protein
VSIFLGAGRLTPRGWPDGITPGFVELGADPSTSGFQAPIGSIAKVGTAYYQKIGSASTDWAQMPLTSPGWQAAEVNALLALCPGLSRATCNVIADGFTNGASNVDFGPNWAVTAPTGGDVTHQISGGDARGGVMTINNPSGAFDVGGVLWKGGVSSLVTDGATDQWGMSFRLKWVSVPLADVGLDARFGLTAVGGGNYCYLGIDGSQSQTMLTLTVQTGATNIVVTTKTIASLAGVQSVWRLIRKPVAGVRNVIAYVDGVEVGRIVGGPALASLVPILYSNKAQVAVDDMVLVTGPAF